MKQTQVVVRWPGGLHLRPAARLMRLTQKFRSTITLTCRGKVADLRSILGVLMLCATFGSTIDVAASGEDEQSAIAAMEQVFSSDDESASD